MSTPEERAALREQMKEMGASCCGCNVGENIYDDLVAPLLATHEQRLEAEHQRADANARWAEETVDSNKDLLRRLEEARAQAQAIKTLTVNPYVHAAVDHLLARLAPPTKMMEND